MIPKKKETIFQFIKYALVGCLNTGITLFVIFVCKSLLDLNPYIANVLGYVAGLINSFSWNKTWVFKSKNGYSKEAIKFAVGFGVCYSIQLLVVFLLSSTTFVNCQWNLFDIFAISGYGVATLIGNIIYTIANFGYNRIITFK